MGTVLIGESMGTVLIETETIGFIGSKAKYTYYEI